MASTAASRQAKEIGARIAQARREAGGMSQRELAEIVKPRLSERSIQAYESGDTIPYRYLREFERVLGKPGAWFLHGDQALAAGAAEGQDEIMAALKRIERKLDGLSKMLSVA